MRKGELWLIDIPDRGGHEQRGTRPALILAVHARRIVTIVPFTSQTRASQFSSTILVDTTKTNGLDAASVLLLYQLGAVDKKRLRHKLGVLDKGVMSRVERELKTYLQFA